MEPDGEKEISSLVVDKGRVSELLTAADVVKYGEHRGRCAVCGEVGSGRWLRTEVVPATSGNVSNLLPYNTGYLCPECATVWRQVRR